MYGAILEECDDVNKVMGEVSSLFTGNVICNIIFEQSREINPNVQLEQPMRTQGSICAMSMTKLQIWRVIIMIQS